MKPLNNFFYKLVLLTSFWLCPGLAFAQAVVGFVYAQPDAFTLASHEQARQHLESRQIKTLSQYLLPQDLNAYLQQLPSSLELLIITSSELGQQLINNTEKLSVPVVLLAGQVKTKAYSTYIWQSQAIWSALGFIAANTADELIIIRPESKDLQANLQAFKQELKSDKVHEVTSLQLHEALEQNKQALVIVFDSQELIWTELKASGHKFIGFCPEPDLQEQCLASPSLNLTTLFPSILMQNRFGMWHDQAVNLNLKSQVIGIKLHPQVESLRKQAEAIISKLENTN